MTSKLCGEEFDEVVGCEQAETWQTIISAANFLIHTSPSLTFCEFRSQAQA